MLPLLHTSTQPRLKFCSKETKASYFDRYKNPILNHDLLRSSFTKTVTEHQKSVHGSYKFGSLYFTNGLLKCLLGRVTKEYT